MEPTPEAWKELMKRIDKMDAMIRSVFNVIKGEDEFSKQIPLMERIARLEQGQKVVKIIIISFGIGLLVGALIWGVITFRQFYEAVTKVK